MLKKIWKQRYQIVEKIGKGGAGRVYKVWDLHLEKEWAMKILEERVSFRHFNGNVSENMDELKALKQIGFDMLYSFLYSPRKGTPAASMEEQIPTETKGNRFERMLAVQNEIAIGINRPLEGQTLRVLCDGISKNNDKIYSGRTEGGKIVFFDASPEDTGHFVNVQIDRGDTFALYGKIKK